MGEQNSTVALAPDDLDRQLTAVAPDDPALQHVGVVSDTYTILVDAESTGGRYALLDMLIPPGGGPPPHRHDFEEMFHVLEGEVVVSFRARRVTARTGMTVNIPARAPHHFKNESNRDARLLCMVSPPGLEEYFLAFGEPLPSRTAAAAKLSEDELQRNLAAAAPLAQRYRIENLPPRD
jgi:mannose-6-phosphate isomerase-like protein (cupin superfamily)